jgi:hypothetical protein
MTAGRRVRLAQHIGLEGYQPGDEGTITRDALPHAAERAYYLVQMDRDGPDAASVLFADEEIELVL